MTDVGEETGDRRERGEIREARNETYLAESKERDLSVSS